MIKPMLVRNHAAYKHGVRSSLAFLMDKDAYHMSKWIGRRLFSNSIDVAGFNIYPTGYLGSGKIGTVIQACDDNGVEFALKFIPQT